MRRCFTPLFLIAVLFVMAACAVPVRHVRPDPFNPVFTVAVLPMYNVTNDVGGARMVREEFNKRIQNLHYSVKPLNEVDQILVDQMGITLGDQLELTTPKQLGETLGVDGVVYGYLLNFDDIITGLYNVKKVRAGFKLVNTRTGEVMWARGLGVISAIAGGKVGTGFTIAKELMDAREGLDKYSTIKGLEDIPGLKDWTILRAAQTRQMGDAAAFSLGESIITKALGVHLMLEAGNMLNNITRGFPAGPGHPQAIPPPVPPPPPATIEMETK